MSMVDHQRYRQHSYFNGGSSAGDHRSSVSAQDVGESQVYQYEGNWFAAVSCVCIRDRLRVVGHLQRRMKMVNHQRINVMDRMELVEETFLRGMMNNGDVIRV